ncbi:ABC transporter ATP-binding protein [Sphingomonas koreensis]|nr:ABC transporter ATP-binding protein [Sphingomonas koreensis]
MDLIVDRLSVTLANRSVLREVSVTLRPGRVTAILGPNGAGKSTLVKAAAALVAASAGAVRLGDRDVAMLAPRERARLIGYLPQDAAVHWNVAAREIVALGRAPHRAPFAALGAIDHAAIDAAIAATEIAPLLDRPIGELSGGERARVLLARVLAGDPAWLLADEPLASLDPAHQIDILDRLRGRAAGGTGVVIVLHDIAQAARAADDILLLKNGQVVGFGPVDTALTAAAIGELFDVAVTIAHDAAGRPFPVPIGRRIRGSRAVYVGGGAPFRSATP